MIDFAHPPRPVRLSFIGGRGHYDRVVAGVLAARVSVWIATANLKGLLVEDTSRPRAQRWRPVLEMFAGLSERGVELRILHAAPPSRAFIEELDRAPRLFRGGLVLKQCPRLHLKAVIVDGTHLYLGSANWTGAGLGAKGASRRNFELGIWTSDEAMLDEVQALYDHLWRGGECAGCGRRASCPAPLA